MGWVQVLLLVGLAQVLLRVRVELVLVHQESDASQVLVVKEGMSQVGVAGHGM